MTKKPKILFVQGTIGHWSEVFSYRLITGISVFNVEVLTGNYINQDHFPLDKNAMKFWDHSNVKTSQKILPLFNRKFGLSGTYSGISKQIIEIINNSDVDLVCFQFANVPVIMGKDFNKIKKKICIIHHGTDVNIAVEDEVYHKRLQNIWKKSDKLIFSSEFLMNMAHKLGCPHKKTEVHYMGVPSLPKITRVKEEDKPFRFICVARMVPVKNHITLIKAFSQAIKETIKPIELVLIGAGELEEHITQEIDGLGINKHVQLLGALNNKDTLAEIAKSDCSLLLSAPYRIPNVMYQEEALGLSLIEGGGMGLPMIGSKSGGIPEIVSDGITGYLVEPLNIIDIKDAMLKIALNPQKSKEMGAKAAIFVEESFNLLRQNKKFEVIFMNIINSKKEFSK